VVVVVEDARQPAIELRRSASEASRVPGARRGEAGMPCELGQNAGITLDYGSSDHRRRPEPQRVPGVAMTA
jgi:hypothetical protein